MGGLEALMTNYMNITKHILGCKVNKNTPDPNPDNTPPSDDSEADEITRKEAELKRKKEEVAKEEAELKEHKNKYDEKQKKASTVNVEEFARLQEELEQKEIKLAKYQAEIDRLNQNVEELQKTEPLACLQKHISELLKHMSSLEERVGDMDNRIAEENQHLTKENEELQVKLDNKQERLESIVQKIQEDRYKKDKMKLINRCIYQMDLIRKTLYDFESDHKGMSEKEAISFLQKQLEEVVKGMEATLAQEMVERIPCAKEGSNINLELQETIDTIFTDDPMLDGKVYRSINPGYIWMLPYILKAKITDDGSEIKNYRFLIRAEQVITYKLNK